MNKTSVAFLSLGLLLASCVSRPSQATPTPALPAGSDPFGTPWEDRSLFRGGLVTSAQYVLDELEGASVYHIEFNILEELYQVKGSEEVRYTNTEDVPLREVWFRLFPNALGGEMTIDRVAVDGKVVEPRYELEDSLMIISLGAPLEKGQSLTFSIDFFVIAARNVESHHGELAYAEGVLALAHAYPMIAVYDEEGWNAEIPPGFGDVVYADMSFFIVRVSAPGALRVIAAGQEVSRSQAGDTQALVFAAGPARDFYLAASPDYEETAQTLGEVTIRSYAPERVREGSQMAVNVAARATENFSMRYAPYPYTELDIVLTPTSVLGIEYPGIIAITSRIYDVDQDVRGVPARIYMESTVAHEVGHQWFYNFVGDDQLDDPWLDESLTQFVTLQYYADEYGPGGEQGFRESLESRWNRVNRAAIPIGLPVEAYSGTEYGAIVYGRGPLFFLALREQMGTEKFDAFLREYTEMLAWEIATPERLQLLAEKHCACDLDSLFNAWVYP